MAKSKTKTKTKKVEKPTKISNEHLNKMQEIINNLNRGQMEIGSIESRKHALLHHISVSQEELGKMQVEFEKTYGTSNINIQDGTINYTPENGKTD